MCDYQYNTSVFKYTVKLILDKYIKSKLKVSSLRFSLKVANTLELTYFVKRTTHFDSERFPTHTKQNCKTIPHIRNNLSCYRNLDFGSDVNQTEICTEIHSDNSGVIEVQTQQSKSVRNTSISCAHWANVIVVLWCVSLQVGNQIFPVCISDFRSESVLVHLIEKNRRRMRRILTRALNESANDNYHFLLYIVFAL